MKRLILLILSVLTLTACTGVIEFILDFETNLPPGLTVSNLELSSNYTATVDGVRQPVICDDKTTILTYSFNFNGALESWTSYLKGEDTGYVPPESIATFNASSANVNYQNNFVSVEYEIPRTLAPTSQPLSSQAIVVNPKTIGATELYVEINGFAETYDIKFKGIPILAACD